MRVLILHRRVDLLISAQHFGTVFNIIASALCDRWGLFVRREVSLVGVSLPEGGRYSYSYKPTLRCDPTPPRAPPRVCRIPIV